MLSGDGNWASLIAGIADTLSARGVAVVGLRSAEYLGRRRTPDEVAHDMTRVLRTYLARWDRSEILIVGYSRGADLAPFVMNRVPDDVHMRVRLVVLLSPSIYANLEFHWRDLVQDSRRPTDIPLLPEVQRMHGMPVLCIHGEEEVDSFCKLVPATVTVGSRLGGHRTDDHAGLARWIFDALAAAPALPGRRQDHAASRSSGVRQL